MLRKHRRSQGRIRLARRRFVEFLARYGDPDEIIKLVDAGKYDGTILKIEVGIFRDLYERYNEDGTER